MYSTPLSDAVSEALAALPLRTTEERLQLLTNPALRELATVFATLPDPRQARGQRDPLAFLLTCLVAALLCNGNLTLAVEQWSREQRDLLAQVFASLPHLTPSGSLYRWLLPRFSVEHLEWALTAWMCVTRGADDVEPMAVDGENVRGAATPEQAAPHLLAFCTHESQATLLQVQVGEKKNEIPVA